VSFDLAPELPPVPTDPSGTESYRAVRNGSLVRQGDATTATIQATLATVRSRPGVVDANIDLTAEWTFTAATPGALAAVGPLPAGTLALTGTLHWRRSTEDWSLTVATPTPLVYTAPCATMAQPVSAGQVTLTGTVAGQIGTLLIAWQGCGTEPARVWIPGP
ncbi:MAG TPA: hypothetical protein VNH46_11360, partial [Gemmatimonadales bacterium]|nr:hypothetical protein [Gemmatimonadales bacterium]